MSGPADPPGGGVLPPAALDGRPARITAQREDALSPWVTVLERTVDFPHLAAPEAYHAFASGDHIAALASVPDGRIALISQFRPAIGDYVWELPAGAIDPGETPEAACRRELAEETGLAVREIT